jgi:hypothetical protein
MREIVIVLSATHAESLGAVRTYPGLRAAQEGNMIWVRGITTGDVKISSLPATHIYQMDDQQRLFIPGTLTPVRALPALEWKSLTDFIKVTLPVSALPGVMEKPHRLMLIRHPLQRETNALLTTLDEWEAYASQAPQIRIQHLYFAVSENNEVLLIGEPLVPVPGKEYTLNNNILLPAGYTFDPPVLLSLVAATLNPQGSNLLLFHPNSRWEKIRLSSFVPATRSAARLTRNAL